MGKSGGAARTVRSVRERASRGASGASSKPAGTLSKNGKRVGRPPMSAEEARNAAYVSQKDREALASQYEHDVRASAKDRLNAARAAYQHSYDEVHSSARQRALVASPHYPKLPGLTTKDVQEMVARQLRTYGLGAMPKSYHALNDARPLPLRELQQFTENIARAQGARAAMASMRTTAFRGLTADGLTRAIDRAVLAETRVSASVKSSATSNPRASRAKKAS